MERLGLQCQPHRHHCVMEMFLNFSVPLLLHPEKTVMKECPPFGANSIFWRIKKENMTHILSV